MPFKQTKESELISNMADNFLPHMIQAGVLGMYELSFPERKLKFFGRAIIMSLFGDDAETVTLDWDDYVNNCHPDDVGYVDGRRWTVFKNPGNYNSRYRVHNRKSGRWRWVHSFGNVVDHGGGRLTISGGMLDVTDEAEHRTQIRAIEESEYRARIMLDTNPLASFLIDDNLEIIECNEAAVRMGEFDSKQEMIESYFDIIPEFQPNGRRSDEMVMETRRRAAEEGSVTFDFLYVLRSGEALPVEKTIRRVPWGDSFRLTVYCHDLRDIKAKENLIREAEEHTKVMLDATPFGCILMNKELQSIDCNATALKIWEMDSKEDLLHNYQDVFPETQPDGYDSYKRVYEMRRKALETGLAEYNFTFRLRSGELMPVEVRVERVEWRGEPMLVGYIRDMRVEEAINRELVAARDLAEASLESKTLFLANMSHEIRTPITAIIGMTDIAKESEDSEKINYCLSKISDASEHLLGIINDILDISKIEAGRFRLSPADFAMERMLARICDILAFRLDQKRQRFDIGIDRQVPIAVIADQQRLTQVIMNLLSNAHKFTPEHGQIMLKIEVAPDSPADSPDMVLQFEVADNGIGVTEEQMERLFDSFEQGDNNIARRYGGTGLGLTISKAIVEQMGGSIWVSSTPGVGSSFMFKIPVRRGAASAMNRLAPEINIANVGIMVVDGMPEIRQYFAGIAETLKLDCRTAGGADECLRLLAEKPADIVFVDWMMPGVDGIELTRQIRRKYDNNVVIMISAKDWEDIKEPATEAGVSRFVTKPLLPSPIIDCINQCFGVSDGQEPKARRRSSYNDIFSARRILLAEDVDLNREIVTAMLADTGLDISYAENGLEACNTFAADPEGFDLILMDIQMPEVDGYSATRRIRDMSHPYAQTVPIIAMTANVFKEDVDKCLAVGMNGHIGKPIDSDVLMETLMSNLIKQR